MYRVKRIASSLIAFFVGLPLLLASAVPVYAQDVCQAAGANFSGLCKLRLENGGGAVGAFIQVLLIICILTALFFMIYGGIKWMSSGGDQAKIQAARSMLIAALVGLVIALLAFFLLDTVVSFFTGKGFKAFTVPRLID